MSEPLGEPSILAHLGRLILLVGSIYSLHAAQWSELDGRYIAFLFVAANFLGGRSGRSAYHTDHSACEQ